MYTSWSFYVVDQPVKEIAAKSPAYYIVLIYEKGTLESIF